MTTTNLVKTKPISSSADNHAIAQWKGGIQNDTIYRSISIGHSDLNAARILMNEHAISNLLLLKRKNEHLSNSDDHSNSQDTISRMMHKVISTITGYHPQTPYDSDTSYGIDLFSHNQFLEEALSDLNELDGYAQDEELTPPSPIAKKFARQMLNKIVPVVSREYSVSLWEDGDVVIYSVGKDWRVSIYCRANGGASLYVNSPDALVQDMHYQDAQELPFDIVTNAFNKIPT